MSYIDKIGNYQGDCKVILGRNPLFSDYIREFSKIAKGHGIDCGSGPLGVNGKFFKHCYLDGCDIEEKVVNSLGNEYKEKFRYTLGKDTLPYGENCLDFVICSCVIQHLNNLEELNYGLLDINRVLKKNGYLYLMFKIGTNNTILTHFNEYYKEERSFRVFSKDYIINMLVDSFFLLTSEYLLDENCIPYCLCIFSKITKY